MDRMQKSSLIIKDHVHMLLSLAVLAVLGFYKTLGELRASVGRFGKACWELRILGPPVSVMSSIPSWKLALVLYSSCQVLECPVL